MSSSSSHYKLYYFNHRGRAELSRLIFVTAGQPYEDVRFDDAQWMTHKKEMPFGQLPVLQIDSEKIGQSSAIAHYLALQFGLAGKTPIESLKCHALAETVRDLMEMMSRIMFSEKDEERKKVMRTELETWVKDSVEKFESYLKTGGTGFLVGKTLTYADLAIYNAYFSVSQFLGRDVLVGHPLLQTHSKTISSVPRIAEYLTKRPPSVC